MLSPATSTINHVDTLYLHCGKKIYHLLKIGFNTWPKKSGHILTILKEGTQYLTRHYFCFFASNPLGSFWRNHCWTRQKGLQNNSAVQCYQCFSLRLWLFLARIVKWLPPEEELHRSVDNSGVTAAKIAYRMPGRDVYGPVFGRCWAVDLELEVVSVRSVAQVGNIIHHHWKQKRVKHLGHWGCQSLEDKLSENKWFFTCSKVHFDGGVCELVPKWDIVVVDVSLLWGDGHTFGVLGTLFPVIFKHTFRAVIHLQEEFVNLSKMACKKKLDTKKWIR